MRGSPTTGALRGGAGGQRSSGQLSFAEILLPQGASAPSGLAEASFPDCLREPDRRTTSFQTIPEFVPVYALRLVRTGSLRGVPRQTVASPRDVIGLLWEHLRDADREHFAAVLLDTKGTFIGVTTVSIGDLNSTLVHPREVFKPAIAANAASVIVAHNHPSGDPTPSPEDIAVTRRLREAGEVLGIELLDHVVIGDGPNRYVSLKEKAYI